MITKCNFLDTPFGFTKTIISSNPTLNTCGNHKPPHQVPSQKTPQKSIKKFPKKMHDFCFTIPYGLLVLIGGLIGYAKRGSVASLAGGVGAGLVLLLAGFVSLKAFEKRRNSYLALIIETACSLALTFIMGQRYLQTSKIMPAGVVAALSALMTAFYLYKIATGGNYFPSKAE